MSMQQEIRPEDRPVLQAPRYDDTSARPGFDKPIIVHRGAGRGTTAVAFFALLAGLGALAVPVAAPLVELVYPDHPVVKALTRQTRAMQEVKEASEATNGRVAAQTARIQIIEASLMAAAERLGRLESRVPLAGDTETGTAPVAASTSAERLAELELHLTELSGRLAALEPANAIATKRIDTLDTVGSNGKTFSARVDGVETRVTELAAALAELSTQHGGTVEQLRALPSRFEEFANQQRAVDALVTGINQRLTTIETAAANANGSQRALRLSIAILQLNNVVQSHRPFSRELAAVNKLWQPAPVISELEVLAAHGDTGIATIAELRDSFSIILAPKLRALAAGADRPFVERVRMWASSWIAPQTPQVAAANPVDLVVDATMEKLAEEDVRGAVDHLASLDGAPATLATRWIVEAKSRIAIDRVMDILLSLGLENLGRGN